MIRAANPARPASTVHTGRTGQRLALDDALDKLLLAILDAFHDDVAVTHDMLEAMQRAIYPKKRGLLNAIMTKLAKENAFLNL